MATILTVKAIFFWLFSLIRNFYKIRNGFWYFFRFSRKIVGNFVQKLFGPELTTLVAASIGSHSWFKDLQSIHLIIIIIIIATIIIIKIICAFWCVLHWDTAELSCTLEVHLFWPIDLVTRPDFISVMSQQCIIKLF